MLVQNVHLFLSRQKKLFQNGENVIRIRIFRTFCICSQFFYEHGLVIPVYPEKRKKPFSTVLLCRAAFTLRNAVLLTLTAFEMLPAPNTWVCTEMNGLQNSSFQKIFSFLIDVAIWWRNSPFFIVQMLFWIGRKRAFEIHQPMLVKNWLQIQKVRKILIRITFSPFWKSFFWRLKKRWTVYTETFVPQVIPMLFPRNLIKSGTYISFVLSQMFLIP